VNTKSFAKHLSRASSESSEITTSTLFAIVEEDFLDWLNHQVSTTVTTPLAARKQPDRERARQAAIALWGHGGAT
jgi:hypothetical protein